MVPFIKIDQTKLVMNMQSIPKFAAILKFSFTSIKKLKQLFHFMETDSHVYRSAYISTPARAVPASMTVQKILESARKICYDMNDFISGSRRNTFGRLGCKDWIKFAAIDPLVFYNDYYGKIDANGDGKLQKSEIEESYRRVLEKYPDCPGIGH